MGVELVTTAPSRMMWTMRPLILVLVVAAGCGKSDSSKQTPAPSTTAPAGSAAPAPTPVAAPAEAPAAAKSACELLTAAEAAEVAGIPMKEGEGDEKSCIWHWTGMSDEKHGISIEVKTYNDPGMYNVLAKRKSAKPVEGLGDRAVADLTDLKLAQFAVAKGSKSALINIQDEKDNPELAQKLNAAATKIVPRL